MLLYKYSFSRRCWWHRPSKSRLKTSVLSIIIQETPHTICWHLCGQSHSWYTLLMFIYLSVYISDTFCMVRKLYTIDDDNESKKPTNEGEHERRNIKLGLKLTDIFMHLMVWCGLVWFGLVESFFLRWNTFRVTVATHLCDCECDSECVVVHNARMHCTVSVWRKGGINHINILTLLLNAVVTTNFMHCFALCSDLLGWFSAFERVTQCRFQIVCM